MFLSQTKNADVFKTQCNNFLSVWTPISEALTKNIIALTAKLHVPGCENKNDIRTAIAQMSVQNTSLKAQIAKVQNTLKLLTKY